MQKSYLNITIIIAMLFSVIVLYPLLPLLAYGKQQQQRQDLFPFSYPSAATTTTTTSKSETNNHVQSESVSPHTLSSNDKKGQNDNANVNYNDNVDTTDNGDDTAADANDSNNNDVEHEV